jgi:predicted GIY-YIG superfamily endonuclease
VTEPDRSAFPAIIATALRPTGEPRPAPTVSSRRTFMAYAGTNGETDFANAPTVRLELYRCFDKRGHLLYVGLSTNARRRANEHRREKPWWGEVYRTEIDVLTLARHHALRVEAETIRDERPKYNSHHSTPKLQPQGRGLCVTLHEAAAALHVSRYKVREMVAAGQLRTLDGRVLRSSVEKNQALLDEKRGRS